MKVLKFGGTSVGTSRSILSVKNIVESNNEPVVVVVSALGGITDKLIEIAHLAARGNLNYQKQFSTIVERHTALIGELISSKKDRKSLLSYVSHELEELKSIFQGVYLINDLSEKTLNVILSYGELLSSNIISSVITSAKWIDARSVIKTQKQFSKHVLQQKVTEQLISDSLSEISGVVVLGGFISSDFESGETTNLGRGGSDYTASVIASTLNASCLEIWTDVDGFMTADPKAISTAYTIDKLSYVEAMELCNFGAKVVYPPTIYPVCHKNIPVWIKNTFNPDSRGTLISADCSSDSEHPVKGVSSINDTSLITVSGLGMVGVIGVNYRIFRALAKNGISVFLVSQASSENSTSIGVCQEDTKLACECLNEEFSTEISNGEISTIFALEGLATVGVVGERMKKKPGFAGKLFNTLGRNGINVIACAQGAAETNISFVIDKLNLRKTLNVIHDSFFLSEYKELNLFICGIGHVGDSLIAQINNQQEKLKKENRLKLNVVGIANGKKILLDKGGLSLVDYKNQLKNSSIQSSPENIRKEILKMNIFNAVFIDCTANKSIASLYEFFLNHNVSVVAANKIAASSDYSNYLNLKNIALDKGVKFLFETNVGAGLPIINTINSLVNSGDKILKIEAVLSGTLNYVFNKLSAEVPFSEAVQDACDEGYAEPDPRIDLSGIDVLRKLVILVRESGYKIDQNEVKQCNFVPDDFFDGNIAEFWRKVPALDEAFEARRRTLVAQNKKWRYVAKFDNSKASVGLQEVDSNHPFYSLEGTNNIIMLTTERYKDFPMLIQGYGAGADVTAAGVFSDIISIANI